MFLFAGIPSAVAMVSPVNDGSKTTNPPWMPLSEMEEVIFHQKINRKQAFF